MNIAIEVLGWSGAVVVLGAYLLSSRDVWPASSAKSAIANVLGAALLTANASYHRALPSAAVNVVWIAIAAVTLWRTRGGRPRARGRRAPDEAGQPSGSPG